ncbi:MAG: hypothetical protein WEC14_11625 [Chloroflexota bacterium]
MATLSGFILDCLGCVPEPVPAGLDQVVIGFLVAAVAIAPGAILHRYLRRRGR